MEKNTQAELKAHLIETEPEFRASPMSMPR